jgi:probable HAF family extracellular repeat protein
MSNRPTRTGRQAVAVAAAALLLAACADGEPADTALAPAFNRAEPSYAFEPIDIQGAAVTNPQGINAAGQIVGAYVQGGVTRGFLWQDGVVETIVVDGAGFTFARGIGPDGTIVGNWRPQGVANPVVSFGFHRAPDGSMDMVGFQGYTHVIPQRILPGGTILGCAHEDDLMASMVGVTMGRGDNEAIGAFASMHNGATPSGHTIAGLYRNMDLGRGEGYLIDRGVFMPLVVPGSIFTAAWDINPRGDVVGVYQSADGRAHGFVRSDGNYTTLDYPNATATRAFGINARGDVVGHYVMSGVTRGFLARRVR